MIIAGRLMTNITLLPFYNHILPVVQHVSLPCATWHVRGRTASSLFDR